MNDIVYFISKNWVNLSLVIVGSLAMLIYILQERQKQKNAASLIVIQIDELLIRIKEITKYINEGKLDNTAFYESLPLMEKNYWSDYKHYFVGKMDTQNFSLINEFYKSVAEIQEQHSLMKTMQKNHFVLMQNVLANNEAQFVMSSWQDAFNGVSSQDIITIISKNMPDNIEEKDKAILQNFFKQIAMQNQKFDINNFWNIYNQRKQFFISMFNNNAFSSYLPEQIRMSLEKVLKQCSMITIIGTDGYNLLKKISKRKI